MNRNELAKEFLNDMEYKELVDAVSLIENSDYEKLYDYYEDIINETISVYSFEEFQDFLNSIGTIDKNVFIFGFLCRINKSIAVGGYEENIEEKIKSYMSKRVDSKELLNRIEQLDANVYIDFDGEDNFYEYVLKLNDILGSYNKKILVFFNDIYSACCYNLLITEKEFAERLRKEWNDNSINLQEVN